MLTICILRSVPQMWEMELFLLVQLMARVERSKAHGRVCFTIRSGTGPQLHGDH